MLKPKNNLGEITRRIIVLLFFISCVLFKQTVHADSKNKTALGFKNKGYASQQKGNFSKAFIYYKKALDLGLEDADFFNDIGIVCEHNGLTEDAQDYYLKSIEKNPEFLPAYTNISYLCKRTGQTGLALKYFIKMLELLPKNDPSVQGIKEEILALDPGYETQLMLERVNELEDEIYNVFESENDAKIKKSYEHYTKGQQYFNDGKYKKSLKEFNKALTYMPENGYIIVAQKRALIRLNKL